MYIYGPFIDYFPSYKPPFMAGILSPTKPRGASASCCVRSALLASEAFRARSSRASTRDPRNRNVKGPYGMLVL